MAKYDIPGMMQKKKKALAKTRKWLGDQVTAAGTKASALRDRALSPENKAKATGAYDAVKDKAQGAAKATGDNVRDKVSELKAKAANPETPQKLKAGASALRNQAVNKINMETGKVKRRFAGPRQPSAEAQAYTKESMANQADAQARTAAHTAAQEAKLNPQVSEPAVEPVAKSGGEKLRSAGDWAGNKVKTAGGIVRHPITNAVKPGLRYVGAKAGGPLMAAAAPEMMGAAAMNIAEKGVAGAAKDAGEGMLRYGKDVVDLGQEQGVGAATGKVVGDVVGGAIRTVKNVIPATAATLNNAGVAAADMVDRAAGTDLRSGMTLRDPTSGWDYKQYTGGPEAAALAEKEKAVQAEYDRMRAAKESGADMGEFFANNPAVSPLRAPTFGYTTPGATGEGVSGSQVPSTYALPPAAVPARVPGQIQPGQTEFSADNYTPNSNGGMTMPGGQGGVEDINNQTKALRSLRTAQEARTVDNQGNKIRTPEEVAAWNRNNKIDVLSRPGYNERLALRNATIGTGDPAAAAEAEALRAGREAGLAQLRTDTKAAAKGATAGLDAVKLQEQMRNNNFNNQVALEKLNRDDLKSQREGQKMIQTQLEDLNAKEPEKRKAAVSAMVSRFRDNQATSADRIAFGKEVDRAFSKGTNIFEYMASLFGKRENRSNGGEFDPSMYTTAEWKQAIPYVGGVYKTQNGIEAEFDDPELEALFAELTGSGRSKPQGY